MLTMNRNKHTGMVTKTEVSIMTWYARGEYLMHSAGEVTTIQFNMIFHDFST